MPELQVLAALKQCSSDPYGLPYISIILSGAVADEIAMPCTTGQDSCSQSKGMVCADLSITKPFGIDLFGVGSSSTPKSPSSLNEAFFTAMKFIGLYDGQDANQGCYSMSSLVAGIPESMTHPSVPNIAFVTMYFSDSVLGAITYVQISATSLSATSLERRFRPPLLPLPGSSAYPTPPDFACRMLTVEVLWTRSKS
jgi:hypothetical protein